MNILDITVPALGVAMSEAVIAEILVNTGDAIAQGDDLVMIETDKALTSIPSPVSGSIVSILVKEGEEVPVGSLIMQVREGQAQENVETPPLGEVDNDDSGLSSIEDRTEFEETDVVVPSSGVAMTEAYVISVHVTVGTIVSSGDPVATIETDKAMQTLEAPVSGVVTAVFADPGDEVAVGRPIATITEAALSRADGGSQATQRDSDSEKAPPDQLATTLATVGVESLEAVEVKAITSRSAPLPGLRPHTLGPRGRLLLSRGAIQEDLEDADKSRGDGRVAAAASTRSIVRGHPLRLSPSMTQWIRMTSSLQVHMMPPPEAVSASLVQVVRRVALSRVGSDFDLALIRIEPVPTPTPELLEFITHEGARGQAVVIDNTGITTVAEIEVDIFDHDVTINVSSVRYSSTVSSAGLSFTAAATVTAKYRPRATNALLVQEIMNALKEQLEKIGAQ